MTHRKKASSTRTIHDADKPFNVVCKRCNQGFHAKPSAVRQGKARTYCSNECRTADIGLRDVECGYCLKPFQVFPARLRKVSTEKIFCSKECVALDQKKKISLPCVQCKAEFEIKLSSLLGKKGAGTFCSMRCKAAYMSGSQLTTSGVNRNTTSKGGKRDDLGGQYFRSAWEANYARYLNWLKDKGEIDRWEFEPDTFEFHKIKRGHRFYTPDFKVFDRAGGYEYHEIKGYMSPQSATKLKRMAKYYPNEPLLLVDRKSYLALEKSIKKLIPNWE